MPPAGARLRASMRCTQGAVIEYPQDLKTFVDSSLQPTLQTRQIECTWAGLDVPPRYVCSKSTESRKLVIKLRVPWLSSVAADVDTVRSRNRIDRGSVADAGSSIPTLRRRERRPPTTPTVAAQTVNCAPPSRRGSVHVSPRARRAMHVTFRILSQASSRGNATGLRITRRADLR